MRSASRPCRCQARAASLLRQRLKLNSAAACNDIPAREPCANILNQSDDPVLPDFRWKRITSVAYDTAKPVAKRALPAPQKPIEPTRSSQLRRFHPAVIRVTLASHIRPIMDWPLALKEKAGIHAADSGATWCGVDMADAYSKDYCDGQLRESWPLGPW